MGMVTEYAYLNGRVSAMLDRLLPKSHLEELFNQPSGQLHLGLSSDLDELINDNNVDPTWIEHSWFLHISADFNVLIRPLAGAAREFFTYWFRKWEITNLKTIVRGKVSNLSAEAIAPQLIELGQLATLPTEQLLHTEDISELLRQLDNTPYSTIARQSRRVFEQEHHLHALDAAIDRHYLLGFEDRLKELDSTQRQHLYPVMSALMDRFNLLWLLRYRFAYQLSPAETYYLLIPVSHATISRTDLSQLVELNSLEEVLHALPEKIKIVIGEANTTFTVEHKLNQHLQQTAEKTLRWRSFTLAKALAYMLLRELQMRQILAIIKGKRLGLSHHLIHNAADAYSTTLMV